MNRGFAALRAAALLSDWSKNSINNLSKLCEYARPLDINIIVENHGGFSSNADYLVNVIENIDHKNNHLKKLQEMNQLGDSKIQCQRAYLNI